MILRCSKQDEGLRHMVIRLIEHVWQVRGNVLDSPSTMSLITLTQVRTFRFDLN